MAQVRVGPLPAAALAAAAVFHAEVLPRVVEALAAGEDLTLEFPPAGHDHRGWRLAAVQGLARDHAPRRINGVEGDDRAAVAAAAAWLALAPGVTGQLLPLDGADAGRVV